MGLCVAKDAFRQWLQAVHWHSGSPLVNTPFPLHHASNEGAQ
jgi:hypothetical protein